MLSSKQKVLRGFGIYTGCLLVLVLAFLLKPASVSVQVMQILPGEQPIMSDGIWHFHFVTKITNRNKAPLILPNFRVEIPGAFQPIIESKRDFFLQSGACCFQIFGGSCAVDKKAYLGRPSVRFLDSDWYALPAYADYELHNLSRMKLVVLSWQAYDNGCSALQVKFQNDTNIKVDSLEGTVIFRNSNSDIVEGGTFTMDPGASGQRELDIFDAPGAEKAASCYVQLDAFRDKSRLAPAIMAPLPSVK